MRKFEVGDRVIVTTPSDGYIGEHATVVGTRARAGQLLARLDCHGEDVRPRMYFDDEVALTGPPDRMSPNQ